MSQIEVNNYLRTMSCLCEETSDVIGIDWKLRPVVPIVIIFVSVLTTTSCSRTHDVDGNDSADSTSLRSKVKTNDIQHIRALAAFRLSAIRPRGQSSVTVTVVIENEGVKPFAFCPFEFQAGLISDDLRIDLRDTKYQPRMEHIVTLQPSESYGMQFVVYGMVDDQVGSQFYFLTPDLRALPTRYTESQTIASWLESSKIESGDVYVTSYLRR